jgi:hypothetical protein
MEGRKHIGVVMRLIPNGDAAWEGKWRTQSLPAGVDQAAAFRVAEGYDFGGATHVVIYETGQDDVDAVAKQVGEGPGETTVAYTKFADFGPAGEGPTKGVVLVFTDCDDPAEEDNFNEWYTGHLHHTIENIDLYAASRYTSNDPTRTPSKYLAIYESQSEDTAKVQQEGVDWWVKGGFEGPKGMVLRAEIPATRID